MSTDDRDDGVPELPGDDFELTWDRADLDNLVARSRAMLLDGPQQGPFSAARVIESGWSDAKVTASLPGGIVFTDPPDRPDGYVGLATGGWAFTIDRRVVPVVARLAEADPATLDELAGLVDVDRAAVTDLVRTLAAIDVVHLVP